MFGFYASFDAERTVVFPVVTFTTNRTHRNRHERERL